MKVGTSLKYSETSRKPEADWARYAAECTPILARAAEATACQERKAEQVPGNVRNSVKAPCRVLAACTRETTRVATTLWSFMQQPSLDKMSLGSHLLVQLRGARGDDCNEVVGVRPLLARAELCSRT